jgi:preprotein translocase subunit SecE
LIRVRILVPVPSQLKIIMNKVTNYFKESYKELMEKVTWPTWSELQQSTVIVLVATILITLLVGVMDVLSSGVLKFIYSLLS